MKIKISVIALIAAAVISLAASGLVVGIEANTGCEGWTVDIGDVASETQSGVQISGWSLFVGGSTGIGSYGGIDDCRVMWEPDGDRCAFVTYSYPDCNVPVCIEWSSLDGQALDDGYEVYVDGVKVFTYVDQVTPETWFPQYVDLTLFDLSCSNVHTVEFSATAVEPWSSFDTYGQVAIDFVELGTEICDCCPDCDEPGTRDLGLVAEILEPECICINIGSSELNFGSLYPGQTSATKYFQIDNCGTVAVDVTVSTVSSFFGSNLWLEGNSWHTVDTWILSSLQPNTSQNVGCYVIVPSGYQAGTESGQLIFWAEKSTD